MVYITEQICSAHHKRSARFVQTITKEYKIEYARKIGISKIPKKQKGAILMKDAQEVAKASKIIVDALDNNVDYREAFVASIRSALLDCGIDKPYTAEKIMERIKGNA